MKKIQLLIISLPFVLTSCNENCFKYPSYNYDSNFIYTTYNQSHSKRYDKEMVDYIKKDKNIFKANYKLESSKNLYQINDKCGLVYYSFLEGETKHNVFVSYNFIDKTATKILDKTNTEFKHDSGVSDLDEIFCSPIVEMCKDNNLLSVKLTFALDNKVPYIPLQLIIQKSDSSIVYYGNYKSEYIKNDNYIFGEYYLNFNHYDLYGESLYKTNNGSESEVSITYFKYNSLPKKNFDTYKYKGDIKRYYYLNDNLYALISHDSNDEYKGPKYFVYRINISDMSLDYIAFLNNDVLSNLYGCYFID